MDARALLAMRYSCLSPFPGNNALTGFIHKITSIGKVLGLAINPVCTLQP